MFAWVCNKKLSEIRAAGGQDELVRLEAASLGGQRHVGERLLLPERLGERVVGNFS